MNSILAWGVLPPLALIFYIWSLDRIEKEPPTLVIKTMLFGAGSAILAVALETAGEVILEYIGTDGILNLTSASTRSSTPSHRRWALPRWKMYSTWPPTAPRSPSPG